MKRTPYVEVSSPLWQKLERHFKFDDEAKRDLIGLLMRSRPLTIVFALFMLAGVAGYLLLLALA